MNNPNELNESIKKNPKAAKIFLHGSLLRSKKFLVACAVIILLLAAFTIDISDIKLNRSKDVTIKYVNKAPNILRRAELVALTEDEILGIVERNGHNTVILNGKVEDIQNIKIKMGSDVEYRAILSIKTESCLKGSIVSGSTIKVLLPCPIDINGYWQEDSGIISQVKVGMRGIFIINKYDENDRWEQDGAILYLNELSDYGMGDGERFAFLEKDGQVVYNYQAFPSLPTAQSLEQVEDYILNKFNNQK